MLCTGRAPIYAEVARVCDLQHFVWCVFMFTLGVALDALVFVAWWESSETVYDAHQHQHTTCCDGIKMLCTEITLGRCDLSQSALPRACKYLVMHLDNR